MPRASKLYQPLNLGYITEVTPLTYPEGSTSDELNSLVTTRKSRRWRFGFDVEVDATWSATAGYESVISKHYWENPGNLQATKFLVLQLDNILHFWDASAFNCSGNKLGFTINLNSYRNSYSSDALAKVDVASGKGYLFVVSPKIEPLYIEYNVDTGTISVQQIEIKVRDFRLLPTVEAFTDKPVNPSNEFLYNLDNQGWSQEYIDAYRTGANVSGFTGYNHYPSLSKHWALGKRPYVSPQSTPNSNERKKIGRNLFDPETLEESIYTGTSVAPLGHNIYNAFKINRTINGVAVRQEVVNRRPITVAFKYGRVFFSDGRLIYYSQIIENDINRAGMCYQEADPTSDEISDLIDTDGGVINILESGSVVKLFSSIGSIVVFTDKGVWEISGYEGDNFKPSAYRFNQVSNTDAFTVADIDGIPVWTASEGIYRLVLNQVSRQFEEQSLTDNTIREYYDAIVSKRDIQMEYDKIGKKLYMLHGTRDLLVFDLLNGSFHPWRVAANSSMGIKSLFTTKASGSISEEVNVVTSAGNVLVGADQVVINERVSAQVSETIKFVVVDSDDMLTFGSFFNTDYYDWTNTEYSCYIESGYIFEGEAINRKTIPMITFFFKENLDDDACKFQHKWDFSDSEDSKLWSPEEICYRSSGSFRRVTKVQQLLRGSGAFVTFRLIGEAGKGMELYGFHVEWDIDSVNQRVK